MRNTLIIILYFVFTFTLEATKFGSPCPKVGKYNQEEYVAFPFTMIESFDFFLEEIDQTKNLLHIENPATSPFIRKDEEGNDLYFNQNESSQAIVFFSRTNNKVILTLKMAAFKPLSEDSKSYNYYWYEADIFDLLNTLVEKKLLPRPMVEDMSYPDLRSNSSNLMALIRHHSLAKGSPFAKTGSPLIKLLIALTLFDKLLSNDIEDTDRIPDLAGRFTQEKKTELIKARKESLKIYFEKLVPKLISSLFDNIDLSAHLGEAFSNEKLQEIIKNESLRQLLAIMPLRDFFKADEDADADLQMALAERASPEEITDQFRAAQKAIIALLNQTLCDGLKAEMSFILEKLSLDQKTYFLNALDSLISSLRLHFFSKRDLIKEKADSNSLIFDFIEQTMTSFHGVIFSLEKEILEEEKGEHLDLAELDLDNLLKKTKLVPSWKSFLLSNLVIHSQFMNSRLPDAEAHAKAVYEFRRQLQALHEAKEKAKSGKLKELQKIRLVEDEKFLTAIIDRLVIRTKLDMLMRVNPLTSHPHNLTSIKVKGDKVILITDIYRDGVLLRTEETVIGEALDHIGIERRRTRSPETTIPSRTETVNAGAGVPNAGAGVPNAGAGVPNAGAGVPNAGAGVPNAGAGVPNAGAGVPQPRARISSPTRPTSAEQDRDMALFEAYMKDFGLGEDTRRPQETPRPAARSQVPPRATTEVVIPDLRTVPDSLLMGRSPRNLGMPALSPRSPRG
jgi:hypothetical protein